ncbi:MAG: phosphate acyltransferase PlsX [Bdellovibrionales bacterium]|nr:phosphate acyltransferase PlsX [Bdellovibrionales bacterium]
MSSDSPALSTDLPIAVDTAGSDRGVPVLVEGAVRAFREHRVRSILVGPEDEIRDCLQSLGAEKKHFIIRHAAEIVHMDESPSRAVLQKPQSSLVEAYRLVESGLACGIISAGNSGAMMAAGVLTCGTLPGVKRPAIASLLPSAEGKAPNVLLDSGANADCHAQNLVQFAVMGSIYYSTLFGVAEPRVGLLSNGTEPSKGTDVVKSASQILGQMDRLNYIGFIEGHDVAGGGAHVVVCDGFVGNVVLKTLEGCVQLIAEQLQFEASRGMLQRLGLRLSRGVFRDLFEERFDYSTYGGAPLLGLAGLAVVLHGSSDIRAVKNALRVTAEFARARMTEKIALELSWLEDRHLDDLEELFPSVSPARYTRTSRPERSERSRSSDGRKGIRRSRMRRHQEKEE